MRLPSVRLCFSANAELPVELLSRCRNPRIHPKRDIHGFLGLNATIFNSPIALTCSWNQALFRKIANAIATEALTVGVNQLFAPVADLARGLRFGRVEEMYGEDPFLAGEMGYAYVTCLQEKNVSAMFKHFAAVGTPEQGLNTAPVHGGERELRTTSLPPVKRAIIDAGALSVMSSYNSYDGIPTVAHAQLLTEILKESGVMCTTSSWTLAALPVWQPTSRCAS
jgi:beta-glucosidase